MSFPSRLERLLSSYPPDLASAVAATRMVFRIAHLLEARIDEALKPFGLVMREYLALVLIADDAVEPVRPSDLSTTLDATRTQVTRLLDGLEAKGLAQRAPGQGDRRSLSLVQTPAAQALLKQATPHVHAAYADGWAALGPEGTRSALGRLRKVHDALSPKEPE